MTDDTQNTLGEQDAVPLIQLRVPGLWKSPAEFAERLTRKKTGWRVDEEGNLVHDATRRRVACGISPHDDELGELFRHGHNNRMTPKQLDDLDDHVVKLHIDAPGGSPEAARVAVDAAAAVVRAGGLGVFVDNSGVCHAPGDFLKLAGDKEPGGLYWAFVILTAGRDQMFSAGMHCLGFRDCLLCDPPDNRQLAASVIHNFLGYTYQSGAIVMNGDTLNGPDGPMFRAFHEPCTTIPAGSPMHNPYGMWRLDPVLEGDIADE